MTGDCELAEKLSSDLKQSQIWHEGGELVDRLIRRIREMEDQLYPGDCSPEQESELQLKKVQEEKEIKQDWIETVAIGIELQKQRDALKEKAELTDIELNNVVNELKAARQDASRLAAGLFRLLKAVEFYYDDTYQNEGPDAQDMIQAKEALAAHKSIYGEP